jgi:hypothetical protein
LVFLAALKTYIAKGGIAVPSRIPPDETGRAILKSRCRTDKTVNGTTTRFVYDPQGKLLGEYDGAGNLIQENIYLGNRKDSFMNE